MDLRVSQLHYYPVKSCRGIRLDEGVVQTRGFTDDRAWMVVDAADGTFRTQRTLPRLATIGTALGGAELRLLHDTQPPLVVPLLSTDGEPRRVTVWGDTVDALDAGDEAAVWLDAVLADGPLRLVQIADTAHRRLDPRFVPEPEPQTGFADGYPFLLTCEPSLHELNSRLPEALPMDRFRPNIVVEGMETPFVIESHTPDENELGDRMIALPEDTWRVLSIERNGQRETCRNVKASARCVITTIDQQRGVSAGREPLATLSTYRFQAPRSDSSHPRAKVLFCWNLIHNYHEDRAPMMLQVGDILDAH